MPKSFANLLLINIFGNIRYIKDMGVIMYKRADKSLISPKSIIFKISDIFPLIWFKYMLWATRITLVKNIMMQYAMDKRKMDERYLEFFILYNFV